MLSDDRIAQIAAEKLSSAVVLDGLTGIHQATGLCEIAIKAAIREALAEQSATHAIELRAYEATVENLEQRLSEAAQVPEWIPVGERLPEQAGSYLVMLREDNVMGWNWDEPHIAEWNFWTTTPREWTIFCHDLYKNKVVSNDVLWWMPLPAAPTEGEKK